MKILVANRGEIAVRIMKTIKAMGHTSVAIYSTADKNAMHAKIADIAVCIGPELATESYLNMLNILVTACSLDVDAIHPGYGFLSENSNFVQMCEQLGITLIGPSSASIDQMGDKINALEIMSEIKDGSNQYQVINDNNDLNHAIDKIGLPLIIKYALGGGGKGMRIVRNSDELESSYEMVLSEAMQNETNPRIFAEKFVTSAKHIEVQVIGDNHGNYYSLGTRDCSMQRNSQKVIEEAPATISNELEADLANTAIEIARAINYSGVGTIEYMVKDNIGYFLEMNTRLQVEHTVTEEIYGVDLVELQIRVALDERLNLANIKRHGHAIECRINAEDPKRKFMPMPGKIESLKLDQNARNDFGVSSGDVISPFYDSMIGKVITVSDDRESAINQMIGSLQLTDVGGIITNKDFCLSLLRTPEFKSNQHTTEYIGNNLEQLVGGDEC